MTEYEEKVAKVILRRILRAITKQPSCEVMSQDDYMIINKEDMDWFIDRLVKVLGKDNE